MLLEIGSGRLEPSLSFERIPSGHPLRTKVWRMMARTIPFIPTLL